MRILFVAIPESIHTARWISQISDQGWELGLFSSYLARHHSDLRNLSIWGTRWFRGGTAVPSVHRHRWSDIHFHMDWTLSVLSKKFVSTFTQKALVRVITDFRPDIIHSLELQRAGYLTLGAKKTLGRFFPTWIATNWGSDIYLFGNEPEHGQNIRRILQQCDYYSCECQRDVRLAKDMGLTGQVLPVLPNAGGLSMEKIARWKVPGPVSERRTVIIKGYQGCFGRALMALEALRLCKDQLGDYSVVMYSAPKAVAAAAMRLAAETGIAINIIPRSPHEEMLRLFGRSRVYIGLSISDGISTSFLEAMAMGSFPIQSCTACADEWIRDGQGGFIVSPEDPQAVARMLRRALSDDTLVNRAAEKNAQTVRDRLDYSIIKKRVVQIYRDIYNSRKE